MGFESHHWVILGMRQRWRVGLVCKTSGLCLSEFDSHHSHKMKIIDFLIQVGTFKSKGEALRAVKNKMTLKIRGTDESNVQYKDIIIDESNINGYIYIESEKVYVTNFDIKNLVDWTFLFIFVKQI